MIVNEEIGEYLTPQIDIQQLAADDETRYRVADTGLKKDTEGRVFNRSIIGDDELLNEAERLKNKKHN